MDKLNQQKYAYFEEINEGILREISPNIAGTEVFVLDVGCGSGALSEAITKKGYVVWGIENHPEAIKKAATRLDKVLAADLTDTVTVGENIGDQKFDLIIFSDVLEHLYDPFSILKFYLKFLQKDGTVLISVPNMVAWWNRLKFLFGFFEYAETGVMDRTHIRFFTFATAKNLVQKANCTIIKVNYTPFVVRAFLPLIKKLFSSHEMPTKNEGDRSQILDSPLYQIYMRYIYPIEYFLFSWWKSLFAFRIIIVGRKND